MKYVFRKKSLRFLIGALDRVGFFLFGFLARKTMDTPKPGDSVLIIRLDHLGDVLTATALPKLIKEYCPGVRVLFLVSAASQPLLDNNPWIDEVIVYNPPWFSRRSNPKPDVTQPFWELVQNLRRKKISAGIAPRGDLRENLLMFLAGIRYRLGYGITGGGFLLSRQTPYDATTHQSNLSLNLLKEIGIFTDRKLKPEIHFSETQTSPILPSKRSGALLVDTGAPSKIWPQKNLEAFIELFLKKYPDRDLFLVGLSNFSLDTSPAAGSGRLKDVRGKLSLGELCAFIRELGFFVGADSGPTHLAACLGIPTIFLFSGTNELERWKPLHGNYKILRHPVPCAPCHLTVCPIEGHPCMSGIAPEEVVRGLDEFGIK